MNKLYKVSVSLAFLFLLVLSAFAQPVITPVVPIRPLVGVLPFYNDATWNWQMAGLQSIGGIPTRNTVCQTLNPSGGDDTSAINSAISGCANNEVVLLSAGEFQVSNAGSVLIGKSNVTLRGSGTCNNASSPYCPTVINIYNGALPWANGSCGYGPFAAASSWTTSGSTITMSISNPGGIQNVTSGTVWDITTVKSIGTVSSWTGTTLTLTSNASSGSSGSSDLLGFTTSCGSNSAVNLQPSAAANQFDFGWSGQNGSCGLIHSAIGCGTWIDADAAQGQTTIQVHSLTGFSVGGWVLIDEASGALFVNDPVGPNTYGQVWAAPDWLNSTGSSIVNGKASATGRVQWAKFGNGSGDMGNGAYPYTSPGTIQSMYDRATSEIHVITAVGPGPCPGTSCTLTFDDPLTIAYRQSGSNTFTGTISSGTLTTTGDSCQTSVAQIVSDTTGNISDGTYVTAVNSCSGGVGNYTLNHSITVGSETMIGGAHQAHVYFSAHQNGTAMAFIQQAGIENLTINKAPAAGITFTFCAYCWAHNVEIVSWEGGAVNFQYTARDQLDGSYSGPCAKSTNNGGEYPIGINDSSTEIYVFNNIIRGCGKGMVGKASAAAVVAYNYQDATMYDSYSGIGDYWLDMGTNASHWTGTHHTLFEGGWGNNCDNDDTHGNAVYHVYFRNWCTGVRTPFTDPSMGGTGNQVNDYTGTGNQCGASGPSGCSSNPPFVLRVIGPMEHVYWLAYIGNVLGMSAASCSAGATTSACGWHYSGAYNVSQNKNIWMPGWNSDAGHQNDSDPNITVSSSGGTYIFNHQNYDVFHGSVFDTEPGYSTSLPNSFYLTSAPSFFGTGTTGCTYTWPWVTPQGSPQIQSPGGGGSCSTYSGLPAKARFDAGTPFVQP